MAEETPFFAVGADELRDAPRVRRGQRVGCERCGESHELVGGTNATTGEPSDVLFTVRCQGGLFLAALDGALMLGTGLFPVEEG